MRRAVLVLAVALVGCGGSKPEASKEGKQAPRQTGEPTRAVDKAVRDLDKTDLPEDMKRELREAKKLLDESK